MAVKIAAVGDNCMDVYENLGKAYPGGNPVNVSVYFVRMGGEASYTGVVGSDTYGALLKKAVSEKGVDTTHVRTVEGSTAITHVELIDGERVMGDYEEGVLKNFTLTAEDVEYLGNQELVVSALWGNCQQYFPMIREKGAKIAYDAATRPEDDTAKEAIPYVNYLFFSAEEDTPALRAQMQALFEQGPEIVVATLGEHGSLAFDGKEFIAHGITPCPVIDTMGAGDSYIAGFLFGILSKESIPTCMQRGADSSAVTIGYFGAW